MPDKITWDDEQPGSSTAVVWDDQVATPRKAPLNKSFDLAYDVFQPALEALNRAGSVAPQVALARAGMSPILGMMGKADELMYRGGGAVSEKLHEWGASPEVAGAGGTAAYMAGNYLSTLPFALLAKLAAAPALKQAGRGLVQSAIKPNAKFWEGLGIGQRAPDAEKAITTFMKDPKMRATVGGVERLNLGIQQGGKAADDLINAAQKAGAKQIPPSAAGPHIRALKQEIMERSPQPQAALSGIDRAYGDFLNHPLYGPTTNAQGNLVMRNLSLPQAQTLKKGTWSILGPSGFSDDLATRGSVAADRAIGSGMREALEQRVPGLSEVNRQTGDLLNLRQVMGTKAAMAGNKNTAGLSLLAENPVAGTAFALDRSAWFNSWLGQKLYHDAPGLLGRGIQFKEATDIYKSNEERAKEAWEESQLIKQYGEFTGLLNFGER